MIFLSAQPDEYYFLWQLQLQVYNFNDLGIRSENIHVIIGYNPAKGLSKDFQSFIDNTDKATFYIYPDERKQKNYQPSIRPHILLQHFTQNPWLENEYIFYHDSDILFIKLPDFEGLKYDDIWYASDTRSYLDSVYIKGKVGLEMFEKMCKLVGIDRSLVEDNDTNAGGAQYFLKKCSASFWSKVEQDSELIYNFLESHNVPIYYCNQEIKRDLIQSWCADMWAIFWNALLQKKQFKTDPLLNFCWANSHISQLSKTTILHYTGEIKNTVDTNFYKQKYIHYSPFEQNLSNISEETCGHFVKQMILRYNKSRVTDKLSMIDTCFILPILTDSINDPEDITTVVRHILSAFKTRIILIELGEHPTLNIDLPNVQIEHYLCQSKPTDHIDDIWQFVNRIIKTLSTPYVIFHNANIALSPTIINQTIQLLRDDSYSIIAGKETIFQVDNLLKVMFEKILDIKIFEENKRKLRLNYHRAIFNILFFEKSSLQESTLIKNIIQSLICNEPNVSINTEINEKIIKHITVELYHLN